MSYRGKPPRRRAIPSGAVVFLLDSWMHEALLFGAFTRPRDIHLDLDYPRLEGGELLEAINAQVDHLAVAPHLLDFLVGDHVDELDPDALAVLAHLAPAPVQVQVGGHGGVEAVAFVAAGQV